MYCVSLASGYLGQFDRRECKEINGPTVTAVSTIRTRDGRAGSCEPPTAPDLFHLEGKENRPKAVRLQLRPDPLRAESNQAAVMPPSMTSSAPVVKADSSLARNRIVRATSAG